jgi:pyruvate/2-oxoglutarate dehydrogenase complex dihydrolipoamide acyltransferase (E2) component
MARFEFKLPDIGEGVTEGEIVAWLIEPGQTITEDVPMVEVMTDKATVTIAAPRSGRVVETFGKVGETVKVHSVLVVFEVDDGVREAQGASKPAPNAPKGEPERNGENGAARRKDENVASAVGDIREDLPGMALAPRRAATQGSAGLATAYFNEKPLATPATRKLARDLGLDLRTVRPTGPFGRVTGDDVRGAEGTGARGAEPADRVEARRPSEAPPAAPPTPRRAPAPRAREPGALEERSPLKGLRKRIFENMARSTHSAAHFTFVEECDVSALKDLRQRLKEAAGQQGANLTFLPFFIKAVVLALRRHPALNSTFDEATQEIVTRRYYNIGIATATEGGLVVPVVKNAGDLSLIELAKEIERLAEDARKGRLKLDDLTGSTFTITSLGQQGGLFATPIIHFPEVAILGIHQMKRKAVVRGEQIVIGDVMLLSLSFDHRLIDGHVGAAFAYELIGLLEHPETMFLDMV